MKIKEMILKSIFHLIVLVPALFTSAGFAQSPNAQYIGCDVPQNLITDEVFHAIIYMKNTGTDIWNYTQTDVTLVSQNPAFNTTWGTYFIIQGQTYSTHPGDTFAFQSYLKAPHEPGDYNFSWQCQNWVPAAGIVPDLTQIPFFGEIANGPVIHVTQRSEGPPLQAEPKEGMLRSSDLQYMGSFKLPGLNGISDGYAFSGLTLKNTAGSKNLLVCTGVTEGGHAGTYIYEAGIPGLVKIIDGDHSQINTAPLVQNWGAFDYDGTSWPTSENIIANCGFWYDNQSELLYWSHYNTYYTGNPSGFPELIATRLNSNGSIEHTGAWNIPNTTQAYKSYWGGVTGLSEGFATAYTGGRRIALGFGGIYTICAVASRGPALGAIETPGNTSRELNILPLMTYPENISACPRDGNYFTNIGYWNTQPTSPWEGVWTGTDCSRAGIMIDLPDKKGYLAFTNMGIGRMGYDYGGYNSDGHYEQCWYFYDLDDLGEVALGNKSATSVLPVSFNVVQYPLDGGLVTGACFDEDTRMVYIYVRQSLPGSRPIVHAYYVTEGYAAGISAISGTEKTELLVQNTPNPFKHTTSIKYKVPVGVDNYSPVQLKIYNIQGHEVVVLVNERKPAGTYSVEWNGTNSSGQQVGSGVYFYQLNINRLMKTKRMIKLN